MSKKIKVKCEASDYQRTFTIKVSDLEMTDTEWDALFDKEKEELIKKEVDGLDQPYWVVEKFSEE
jgi:hypothetical protein